MSRSTLPYGIRPPITRIYSRKSGNRLFVIALTISLAIHLCFVFISRSWQVATIQHIEKGVETLFKVRFRQLESRNFVSRPTQEELQEERERLLNERIDELSQIPSRTAEPQLTEMIPTLEQDEIPEYEDNEGQEDEFVDDRVAKSLITSDSGNRAIENFEQSAGKGAVTETAQTNRISLTGRGEGSRRRLLAGLPAPIVDTDPVVDHSLSTMLIAEAAPPEPNIDISEPQIELPPVNELLPSPELMRSSPRPTTLEKEEEAKEQMRERYVSLDDLVDVDLFTYHHIGGDGYFMVRIRPTAADERLQILPKDVILVLDASASMGRRRIEVLKRQLLDILERLRPADQFNVVGFKRRVRKFTETFVPATEENVSEAWDFIKPLKASGRTDIYRSLEPLVQLGTKRARPLILILLSDGRPNVGVVNSRKIINDLTRFRGPSTSIFCVGTGEELNNYLLDMLAYRNRGLVAFERDNNELPAVIQSVFGYVEDPVLLKISPNFGNIDETKVYPKVLPDLYLKGELRIWGRLEGEKKITLRLVGEAFDEQKEMIVELPVPPHDNGTYEIARDWARHKAYYLVGRMVEEGDKPELLEEIRNISRTYNIQTPYSKQISTR